MQNLENKQENCNILTICNARGMLRVSKGGESLRKASFAVWWATFHTNLTKLQKTG